MEILNYELTSVRKLRTEAHFSTPEGQRRSERYWDNGHRYLEWRIRNEGYVLPPEMVEEHEKWRAKHPELYTNPHK